MVVEEHLRNGRGSAKDVRILAKLLDDQHAEVGLAHFCPGGRIQLGTVPVDGRRRAAILTDGPWLLGAGEVRGVFRVRLPAGHKPAFVAACGLVPENIAKSDGVTFRVLVIDCTRREQELWARHLRQASEPVRVDLTPWAGQEVELARVADSGPRDDFGWDLGAWVEPRICVED